MIDFGMMMCAYITIRLVRLLLFPEQRTTLLLGTHRSLTSINFPPLPNTFPLVCGELLCLLLSGLVVVWWAAVLAVERTPWCVVGCCACC
jgi:hypothetical protein